MPARAALVVAKYLALNYVVNPVVKKHRKAGLLVLALILFSVLAAVGAMLASPRTPVSPGLREAYRRLGVNKYTVTGWLSAALTAILLLQLAAGKPTLGLVEEAEYEVLLAQPISMGDYIAGRLASNALQLGSTSLYMAAAIPLAYALSGNPWKAALLPLSVFLLYAYLAATDLLVRLVKIALRGHSHALTLAAAAYLAAGAAHTALLRSPSPLLAAPYLPPVASIVYTATRAESLQQLLACQALAAAALAAVYAASLKLASRLTPESILPAPRAEKPAGPVVEVYAETPGEAVRRLILYRALRSRRAAVALVAAFAAAVAAGLLLRAAPPSLLPRRSLVEYVVSLLVPLIVSEAASMLASYTISGDLAPLWVYRVYLADPEALAGSLVLKHAAYYSVMFAVAAVFEAVLLGDPARLGLAAFSLPAAVAVAALTLAATVYMASRRRIVRRTPAGLYILEEAVLAAVFAVVLPMVFAAMLLYTVIDTLAAVLFGLAAAPALYIASTRLLAALIDRVDVAG